MLTLNQFGQVNSSGLKKEKKNCSNLITVFRLYCLFLISLNENILARHSRSQFLTRECARAYLQALFFATFVQMKLQNNCTYEWGNKAAEGAGSINSLGVSKG